jgi:hypothetical protein
VIQNFTAGLAYESAGMGICNNPMAISPLKTLFISSTMPDKMVSIFGQLFFDDKSSCQASYHICNTSQSLVELCPWHNCSIHWQQANNIKQGFATKPLSCVVSA